MKFLIIPDTWIIYRYCVEHAQEYETNRLKPKCKLLPPLPSADTILSGLSHYVKTSQNYRRDGSLVGATADELLQQIEKDKNLVVNPFGRVVILKLYIPSEYATYQILHSFLVQRMLMQAKSIQEQTRRLIFHVKLIPTSSLLPPITCGKI